MKLPLIWLCISALVIACLASASSLCAEDKAPDHKGLWLDPRLTPLPSDKLGPFVATSDGGIVAIESDSTSVSRDGGVTWSEPRPVFTEGEAIRISNERAMLRSRNGTIVAAFMNLEERHWTWDNELGDAPGAKLPTYVMRSLDDGLTWQDVQKLHDDWSGAVRDMIETRDGRILFTAMKMRHDPGRHSVLTYSSIDDGASWKPSNLIDLGGAGHHGGVTEPTVVQLGDGRLWMLIRTNWSEFWAAYSSDGGLYWSIIQPSGIPASSAPAMLTRLASGRLMLLWNRPLPEGKTEWPLSGGDNLWSATPVSNHREELSLAFSDDEGRTWSDSIVIAHAHEHPGKGSARWIAYPYVFETQAGKVWITTMQGKLRAQLNEADFVE